MNKILNVIFENGESAKTIRMYGFLKRRSENLWTFHNGGKVGGNGGKGINIVIVCNNFARMERNWKKTIRKKQSDKKNNTVM